MIGSLNLFDDLKIIETILIGGPSGSADWRGLA